MSDCDHQRRTGTTPRNVGSTSESDRQLVFLEELVEEHATIAGDVVEIDTHTWAIHGSIAVDGDVIMAEFDTEEHARTVLGELSDEEPGADRR